jgi:hypothetical protein
MCTLLAEPLHHLAGSTAHIDDQLAPERSVVRDELGILFDRCQWPENFVTQFRHSSRPFVSWFVFAVHTL